MKMKHLYLTLMTVLSLGLFVSCIKEDSEAMEDVRSLSMAMNISTRAGSEIQPLENAIQTLRVYAFLGQAQIGYYYDGQVTPDEQGKVSFVMDLALPSFSTVSGKVKFYLVANDASVRPYGNTAWKEQMTKEELENQAFEELLPSATRSSLPMAVIQEVAIDPRNVEPSKVHEGHWQWTGGPIQFKLQRAVAKLGMFFAKKNEGPGELVINNIEVLPQGLRNYNYFFEPTSEKLNAVPQTWQTGFSIGTPLKVTKVVTDSDYSPNVDVNQLSSLYDDGLPQAGYMFENPYGSDNPNNWGTTDTGQKGFVVRVTYTVNGSQSQKDIYLPPTQRNTYYYVLNRIGMDGVISLVYAVANWEDGGKVDIEWGHPTFTFSAVGEVTDFDRYCRVDFDPTHPNADDPNAQGVSFIFNMSSPKGQIWSASIENAGKFTLWIDGKKASGDNIEVPQMTADGLDHTLKITANEPNDEQEYTTKLTIKSVMWGEPNANLNINSENKFPGGSVSSIEITQNKASNQ